MHYPLLLCSIYSLQTDIYLSRFSLCRLLTKLQSLDIEVVTNLIVEVKPHAFQFFLLNCAIHFFAYLVSTLLFRVNNKSSLWSCGSWWSLPLAIPWSFLLSCSWYQSMNIFYLVLQCLNSAMLWFIWKINLAYWFSCYVTINYLQEHHASFIIIHDGFLKCNFSHRWWSLEALGKQKAYFYPAYVIPTLLYFLNRRYYIHS